mmetsp:Transcript_123944/g.194315  ORF Transcript_123944/g.194315 Transcript_123944/m.194315 type:complete len:103 (-) Transcript_123944:36-344(-)
MDGGESGAEGPPKEEDGACKKCCFAILDCIAVIVRCVLFMWNDVIFYSIKRVSYPTKEAFWGCVERCYKWKNTFRQKFGAPVWTPQFSCNSLGGKSAPGFQY